MPLVSDIRTGCNITKESPPKTKQALIFINLRMQLSHVPSVILGAHTDRAISNAPYDLFRSHTSQASLSLQIHDLHDSIYPLRAKLFHVTILKYSLLGGQLNK